MTSLDLCNVFFGIVLFFWAVTGLVGNLSVCIVIVRNKSMHASTNCYLFTLAVCDILIILCDVKSWIIPLFGFEGLFSRQWCLFDLFAGEIAFYCVLLIVTAVSISRYLIVCHPLRLHNMVNDVSKTIKIIFAIVVLGSCLALPGAIRYVDHCNTEAAEIIISNGYKLSTSLSALLVYLIVMIGVTAMYLLIIRKLRKSNKSPFPNLVVDQENRKVIKMLTAMIFALFICWTPLQIFHYLSIHTSSPVELNNIARFVEELAGVLFYKVSTVINPIYNHFMSEKFREAFETTWGLKRKHNVSVTAITKTDCENVSLNDVINA